MNLRIPKPKSKAGGLIELVVIVALALGLALAIQAWIVKPYQIPSGSMEPTLDIGQRVLVNRFIYHLHEPKAGDIVVFHPPEGAESASECGVLVKKMQPLETGEPCPKPTAGRVVADLHQADRRRSAATRSRSKTAIRW